MKAILIYSGGLDSTTLLYEYRDSIALAVSFDYGSKHNARELACARENCRRLDIPHLVISLDFIRQYFHSDLLQGGGEIPEGSYADENMRSTVVPFRNGIMLAVAAGLAAILFLYHPAVPEDGIITVEQPTDPVAVVDAPKCMPESMKTVIFSYFQSQPLYAPSMIKKVFNDNGYL